ncbi:MAG: hypothetical protein HKO95_04910 [Rhodobacteraceae bacterium]|jgi:thiosulfate dehydrogenase|nr:c-type cytochrome [Alphaproteobacteria bacterium]NNK66054.1 hypothetical protein [Paracoccaceae bacterium]
MKIRTKTTALIAAFLIAGPAIAQEHDESYHADYIFGAPQEPTDAWIITRGGRLYDNWYATQDMDAPENTHPAWPTSNSRTGATTWRCKSCHGWDYRGADGKYGTGSYETGIAGVMGYSGDAAALEAVLRDHGYSEDMIPSEQSQYIAAFLAQGLDDMNAVIDFDTGEVPGDTGHGAAIFQTNCAACHGFDGRSLDWGDADEPGYVGTEANANPWEVLHKIRNGHPGVEMTSLRAFDLQDAVDVLAYTRTLPEK